MQYCDVAVITFH